jgi:hypothetical protein
VTQVRTVDHVIVQQQRDVGHLYNLCEPRQHQQEHSVVLLMVLRPDTVTAEEMAGVGVNDGLMWNGMDTEMRKADKDTRFD